MQCNAMCRHLTQHNIEHCEMTWRHAKTTPNDTKQTQKRREMMWGPPPPQNKWLNQSLIKSWSIYDHILLKITKKIYVLGPST